ncbi:hypothetical protein BDF20DRAFT_824559 [Mycotypha africana]|uniref:uncharacterized protein n=1 Tax=Mycotypha africana TaxID=64632 RepID=UPI0023002A42|nr:uncharacterized protein BDF20DRAFT_824559 [Mycotypha africana]KAI8971932.1 hypothetical protein BDF20DRAFT_824559 [Mycotypha africana]
MMMFKLIHGHLFYDGLAIHVPEGIAQGSVVLILVLAILIAIPYRGVIFGLGKQSAKGTVIQFIRKYHGYAMSFGTVLNFHYHPVSHRNKAWILLLETYVFIHGTLTAIIQPGIGWQIFSYGFMVMFLLNQIFQTKFSRKALVIVILYSVFALLVYLGFRKDGAYYRITFIPIAEYACVYFILAVGSIISCIACQLSAVSKKLFVTMSAFISCVCLTVGLALILAGNLSVYNDY